jgi:succinyl-diaminopimelate desuccinylase
VADLLARTAELVAVPSLSHHEAELADLVEAELRGVPWLVVDRLGDNVVARTDLGRPSRLLLAGHLDTVPGDQGVRVEGDVLHGLGAADMKGALAVYLELARSLSEPLVDVTYVFYACEEVAAVHSGLAHLYRERPELLVGDAAICGEPTDGWIEAGCQGTMRLEITFAGVRAHTARPWTGVNAVHRMGRALALVDAFEERRPVLDGCEFREALQAVRVEGGGGGNVVPDRAILTVNHRVAPDRTMAEAEAGLLALLAPALGPDDEVAVVDCQPPAAPGLSHPLLATLVAQGLEVRSKLGWTDVARFAEHGVPACNVGPGDPLLAHAPDERVTRAALDRCHEVLSHLLTTS